MSLPRWLIYFFVIACIIGMSVLSFGQAKPGKGDQSSNQWASHQMHQPPPDPTANRTLSQHRIDDIMELVALAMKELEGKQADKGANPGVTDPQKPSR